jgi:hypothetical protein
MRVGISTYLDVYCFDNCVRSSFGAHTASVQWVFLSVKRRGRYARKDGVYLYNFTVEMEGERGC